MNVEPVERIAKLEARADAQEKDMEELKTILKEIAGGLKEASGILKEHAAHISILIRLVYGMVGSILLSVIGVAMRLIFK